MAYELTPDALELGLNAAGPAEFEFGKREFGRGERSGAQPMRVNVRIASRLSPMSVAKLG